MIQKFYGSQQQNTYEILDYVLTPAHSAIDTFLYVDGTMQAEITMELGTTGTNGNTRIFSNNGVEVYGPYGGDWASQCTWGLQFESNGTQLAVAPYGQSYTVPRARRSYDQLKGTKYRYNLNTNGSLVIYNADDTVYWTFNAGGTTSYVAPQVTTLCFFCMNTVMDNIMYVNTKVYDMKVWQGGSLVRHYIPAKRLSDNICGFYEEVNGTFFPNMWTKTSDPNIDPNIQEEDFTGVSKATPEYISEIVSSSPEIKTIKCGSTDICRIYNGGRLYFGTLDNYTYELLDHLVTPSESFVDTGLTADSSVVVEFVLINNQYDTSRTGRFFSTYDEDWWGSNGTWSVEFENSEEFENSVIGMIPLGGGGYYISSISSSDVNNKKLRFNATATGYLEIYDMNDVLKYSFNVASQSSSYSTVSNITLLGVMQNSSSWSVYDGTQVFYYKIWKNNTLVRHYVPVRRLADDVVGLYDLVNGTFNPNDCGTPSYVFTGVSKATPEYI